MMWTYDRDADALYITLDEGANVVRSIVVDSGTIVDVDERGDGVGIEILRPARDWPLDEVARIARLSEEQLLSLKVMSREGGMGEFPYPSRQDAALAAG